MADVSFDQNAGNVYIALFPDLKVKAARVEQSVWVPIGYSGDVCRGVVELP